MGCQILLEEHAAVFICKKNAHLGHGWSRFWSLFGELGCPFAVNGILHVHERITLCRPRSKKSGSSKFDGFRRRITDGNRHTTTPGRAAHTAHRKTHRVLLCGGRFATQRAFTCLGNHRSICYQNSIIHLLFERTLSCAFVNAICFLPVCLTKIASLITNT